MPLEQTLRNIVRPITPTAFRPMVYLPRMTFERVGGRVWSGPFKGMRYVRFAHESCYIPKILGIYERELNPVILSECAAGPRVIVDIGAAEGYYAVGTALLTPGAKIVAYEMEVRGRELLKEMCEINGVANRVEIRGKCEPADLTNDLGDGRGVWIICDCEGYEETLLDPSAVPALRNASILVEMHDVFVPGLSEKISTRFAGTHRIETILETERSISDYPFSSLYTRLCPKRYLKWAVSEGRPGKMSWLWMRAKGTGGGNLNH